MKILDTEINLKENLYFSLNTYLIWWVILLITIIFDYLTTLYFVGKLGSDAEANKIVGWLIVNLGLYIGLFVGKLMQLISVILFVCLNQRLGYWFLLIVILLNCWAVFINLVAN